MKVFIVHAHPEPQSFNAALTRHAQQVLQADGHEVRVSDLYAMGWNPISGRHNFTTTANAEFFRLQQEELHATQHQGFSPEVQAEMDKVQACDVLIFQFPLWWFSIPAILKGWVDRVFAMGFAYGGGRWYDRGVFKGKRAMLSLTTGGASGFFSPEGLSGDLMLQLYPIHYGTLRFCGFDVLPPHVSFSAAKVSPEQRAAYLESYAQRLRTLATTEPIAYPSLDEFDENFRRRVAG